MSGEDKKPDLTQNLDPIAATFLRMMNPQGLKDTKDSLNATISDLSSFTQTIKAMKDLTHAIERHTEVMEKFIEKMG